MLFQAGKKPQPELSLEQTYFYLVHFLGYSSSLIIFQDLKSLSQTFSNSSTRREIISRFRAFTSPVPTSKCLYCLISGSSICCKHTEKTTIEISSNVFSTALLLQQSLCLQHPGEEVAKNHLDSAIQIHVAFRKDNTYLQIWAKLK